MVWISEWDWTEPPAGLLSVGLRFGYKPTHEMPWNSLNVPTLLLTNIFSVTFKNKNECFKARKEEMEFGYVKFSWIPTNRVGNSNSLSSVLLQIQFIKSTFLLTWPIGRLDFLPKIISSPAWYIIYIVPRKSFSLPSSVTRGIFFLTWYFKFDHLVLTMKYYIVCLTYVSAVWGIQIFVYKEQRL